MNKVKYSIIDIIKLIRGLAVLLVATASFIYLLFPDLQKYINKNYYHYIDTITFGQWILIIFILSFIYLIMNIIEIVIEKQENIKYRPLIKLSDYGKDDVYQNANIYGANSFISPGLNRSRKLIFLDFINAPTEKRREESNAVNVYIYLRFYDSDGMNLYHKSFIGRWIGLPEREFGRDHSMIFLSSNSRAERLGVGYIDNNSDCLILLDSSKTDLSMNGIYANPDFLSPGNYVMVASINGENVWGARTTVFAVTIENGDVDIKEKENGIEWVKKAERKTIKMWEPEGFFNKIKYKIKHFTM